MAVISVETQSTTGQTNDTFEHIEAGVTSDVTEKMSSKGNISTATLPDEMQSESFTITRGGTEEFVHSTEDLKPHDLVRVGGLDVTWEVCQSMGLAASVVSAIDSANANQAYKTQGGSEPEREYVPEAEAKTESAQDILEQNLFNAVSDGDMTSTTAGEASLFADTVAMAGGTDLETALGIFAEASASGGFSNEMLQELGMADNMAQARLEGLSAAIEKDIRTAVGDSEFEEMRVFCDRYDQANSEMRSLALRHFIGGASRSEWIGLQQNIKATYGDRL